jgi:hypothetical protein
LAEQVREADENDVIKEVVLDPFSGKSEKEDDHGFEMFERDEGDFDHGFAIRSNPQWAS